VRLRLGLLAPLVTPLLFWQLRSRLHLEREDLEPIRSIGQLATPVLIAAGSEDQHTTLSETEALYDAARDPKELWIVTGAKHQDLLRFDSSGYEAHVLKFLTQRLRGMLPQPQQLNKTEVEQCNLCPIIKSSSSEMALCRGERAFHIGSRRTEQSDLV
jgi:hypothetical protein